MSKTLTIKGCVAILFIVLGLQNAFSQTIWTETFSNQTTTATNWIHAGSNLSTTPVTWSWTDNLTAGAWTPGSFGSATGSTGYVWFDSDANGTGLHKVTLTGSGAAASCTGKSNVHLKFYTLYRIFAAGASFATVDISIDGGTTWTAHVPTEFPVAAESRYEGLVDIAVPEADNQASVMVRFRWEAEFEYYWKIDDLELYEYTAPLADVTFKVNAALLTVDPAGMKIAGSFTNWADANMTNQGNGVWAYTATGLEVGTKYLYKFKNGANGWESGQAACGESDGFGGFNRTYTATVGGSTDLLAVCFNSCGACVVPCNLNPNSIICDNLDTYVTSMKLGPQATHWTTWSGTEGNTEDGIVSTEQAASAPNSLKIISTAATGGPQDVVLNLGNKTTGNYSLEYKFFVPTAKQGYYNIQNVVPIGAGSWNLDVNFEDAGAGRASVGGVDIFTFTYPMNTWFTIEHKIDLDNNILKYYINNAFVGSIPFPNNLGGIDFFGTNNISTYYVDDIAYVSLPPVVYNVDVCSGAVDLTASFGGVPGVAATTGIFDNTTATAAATDPTMTSACWGETTVTNSQWFNFSGDGKRYHIETVPCNAANYIGTAANDIGDTQLAIFSGTDCTDLTPVVCNDDLSQTGAPDWRAGVDIETVVGQNYYMMIDGFQLNGTIAIGEYCIQVTQQGSVSCAQGQVGLAMANPFLCFGDTLAMTIEVDSTIIPTVGPIFGMSYAISTAPIPAGTYPPTAAGYLAGFIVQQTFIPGALVNDASISFLTPGTQYFFTPVVLGGGENTTGAANFLHNVDVTNGCFFTGESVGIFFAPDQAEIDIITGTITSDTPTGTGTALNLEVSGGLGEFLGDESVYTYVWSNGATTQDIVVTQSGNYTVTISDFSGCYPSTVATIQNVVSTGIKDPSSVKSISIMPNPTANDATLVLTLEKASSVRAEIVNSLGQVLQTRDFGKLSVVNERFNFSEMAEGVYFLRLTIDGERTQRNIIVNR